MRIDNDPKLDFDDVLIRPKRSEAPSRATIVLQRAYRFLNSGAAWKGIPIVASNMDTVGTMAMAEALGPEMMTCLHKYYPEDRLDRVLRGRCPSGQHLLHAGDQGRRVRQAAGRQGEGGYPLRLRRCGERLHQVLRGAGQADQGDVPGDDHHGGERRHAGHGPGTPDLRGRRHRQDRDRPGERLHDPHDDRRRLPPALGDHRVRRRRPWPAGARLRRRRLPVARRCGQGIRRRCRFRDARRHAGGARRMRGASGSRRRASGSRWRSTGCRAGRRWTGTPGAGGTTGRAKGGRRRSPTRGRSRRRSRRSREVSGAPVPTSGRPA